MNRSKRTALTGTVFTVSLLLLLACAPASEQAVSLPAGGGTSEATTPAELPATLAAATSTATATVSAPPAEPAATATGTPTAPPNSALPAPTHPRQGLPTPMITRVPEMVPQVTGTAATGEVPPDLLAAIIADLAANQRILPTEIGVARAEAVTWPSGALGCPEPGMSYIDMLVEGYWVVLQHAGQTFDYRATNDGYFRLCSSPTPGNH